MKNHLAKEVIKMETHKFMRTQFGKHDNPEDMINGLEEVQEMDFVELYEIAVDYTQKMIIENIKICLSLNKNILLSDYLKMIQ